MNRVKEIRELTVVEKPLFVAVHFVNCDLCKLNVLQTFVGGAEKG